MIDPPPAQRLINEPGDSWEFTGRFEGPWVNLGRTTQTQVGAGVPRVSTIDGVYYNLIDGVYHDPVEGKILLLCRILESKQGSSGMALETKLNRYLSYILDGYLAQAYPDWAGSDIWIVAGLVSSGVPQHIQSLLDRAATQVRAFGIQFRCVTDLGDHPGAIAAEVVPPDWYRDSVTPDIERWWDGNAWSGQFRHPDGKYFNAQHSGAYAVLGLPDDASDVEIKSAIRNLSRRYHPDLHPNDRTAEEEFKRISSAYTHLKKHGMGSSRGTASFAVEYLKAVADNASDVASRGGNINLARKYHGYLTIEQACGVMIQIACGQPLEEISTAHRLSDLLELDALPDIYDPQIAEQSVLFQLVVAARACSHVLGEAFGEIWSVYWGQVPEAERFLGLPYGSVLSASDHFSADASSSKLAREFTSFCGLSGSSFVEVVGLVIRAQYYYAARTLKNSFGVARLDLTSDLANREAGVAADMMTQIPSVASVMAEAMNQVSTWSASANG